MALSQSIIYVHIYPIFFTVVALRFSTLVRDHQTIKVVVLKTTGVMSVLNPVRVSFWYNIWTSCYRHRQGVMYIRYDNNKTAKKKVQEIM